MRKVILATVLFVATAATAQAQTPDSTKKTDSTAAKPAGPPSLEGNWSGAIETPNGSMNVMAAIKKAPGGYTGTISGMEGDVPLRDIEMVGDTVTAVATMSAGGQSIEVWYSFLFKDGALNGKVDANVGGQSMSLPLRLRKTP